MSGNVHPLRPQQLSRMARTEPLPLYLSKRDALDSRHLAILERIEHSFYRATDLTNEPQNQQELYVVVSEYHCPQGRGLIRYRYRSETDRFFLLNFELHSGGGGGRSIFPGIPVNDTCDIKKTACGSSQRERVAARYNRVTSSLLNGLHRLKALLDVPLHSKLLLSHLSLRPLVGGNSPASLIDFVRKSDSYFHQYGFEQLLDDGLEALRARNSGGEHLPEWSIIHTHLKSSKETHNFYTDRIISGETVGRLFEAISLDEIRTLPKQTYTIELRIKARCSIAHSFRKMLLKETQSYLALLDNDLGRPSRNDWHCLRVMNSAADKVISDDRLSFLARSEVTSYLALIVCHDTLQAKDHFDDTEVRHRIFRQFAQLNDFVFLSDKYFGLDEVSARLDDTTEWSESMFKELGSMKRSVVQALIKYGAATHSVTQSCADANSYRFAASDTGQTREILAKIVEDICLGNAEPVSDDVTETNVGTSMPV